MTYLRFATALAFLSASAFTSVALAGDVYFMDEARNVFGKTLNVLDGCGLSRVDHEDPRLPRPQVPADDAIINRAGAILAYTNFELGGGARLEIKNPNGGYPHSIEFSSENVQYKTPYAGVIAETQRFRTPAGWQYRFRCGSQYVSYDVYQQCVTTQWVNVVTNQLCR